MTTLRLTRPAARRIAVAAQGFTDPRPQPGAATMRQVQRVIDRVKIVQIDSVNVLVRSQYLPFFSRLGPYDRALLDRARDTAPRRLVEYWAHEASLVPPATWPLLGFRMDRARQEAWSGMRSVAREYPQLVGAVLAEVARRGPLTSRQVEAALAHDEPRTSEHWGWNWSLVKSALEHLFWSGEVTSAGRTAQFERRYALPQRVFPPAQRAATGADTRPDDQEAFVDLIRQAAQAHGIGSALCLRDYFRLRPAQAQPAIERLVSSGELIPCEVPGWRGPLYLHAQAARPRRISTTTALLSPFDSLIWQRERTEALFDFRFRLSLYVPAHQRTEGYYVLPLLLDDELVGRVDLKADRAQSTLRAPIVTWEASAPPHARQALAEQLRAMADWLELTDLDVPDLGLR